MTLYETIDWIQANPAEAQRLAEQVVDDNAADLAADDLECITEAGLRRGLSKLQAYRVKRLAESIAHTVSVRQEMGVAV